MSQDVSPFQESSKSEPTGSPLFMRTSDQEECLVFGYVRTNFKDNVPVAISHLLFRAFHDDNIYMKFNGDKLKDLLSMNNHTSIYSKFVRYKGMELHCSIAPNGWSSKDKGQVIFYLEAKSIPDNIKSVTFITKMFCVQTNTKYETTSKREQIATGHVLSRWTTGLLPLSLLNFMNVTKLEFICNIEILKIEYKAHSDYIKPGIQLSANSKIEWVLSKKDWDLFSNVNDKTKGKTVSNLNGPCCVNGCCIVEIEKETLIMRQSVYDHMSRKNSFDYVVRTRYWIKTRLRQWPQNIGSMLIRYKIDVSYRSTGTQSTNWNKKRIALWKNSYDQLHFSDGDLKASVNTDEDWPYKIVVEFQIEKVFADPSKSVEISKDKWSQYGII